MAFGFLIYPGFEELDMIGPWEMVAMWSAYANGPSQYVTVAQSKDAVTCAKGLKVLPDHDFKTCPELDYLLVPGGFSAFDEMKNDVLIDFVRERAATCQHVLSVCTGSFILHAAGLLEGKRAATNWKVLEQFKELSGVTLVEERWVRDGSIWTGGGVSAGIDLTLAFIRGVAGEDIAAQVQLNAEYYPDGRVYGDAHLKAAGPAYFSTIPAGKDA